MTAVGEGELLTSVSVARGRERGGRVRVHDDRPRRHVHRERGREPRRRLGADRARLRRRRPSRWLTPGGTDEASVRKAVADAALDPPSDVHALRRITGAIWPRSAPCAPSLQAAERGR